MVTFEAKSFRGLERGAAVISSRALLVGLAILALGYQGPASGAGEIAGRFTFATPLPEGAELRALLVEAATGQERRSEPVTAEGDAIPFSFSGVEPDTYSVRLVAVVGDERLLVGDCDEVALGDSTPGPEPITCTAMRREAAISGAVTLRGDYPQGRLVFVRARRSDMTHESWVADGVNNASYDLDSDTDTTENSSVDFEFEGLSYGVYDLELVGYDYMTHEVTVYGGYPGGLVLDVDRQRREALDFKADFGVGSG